MSRRPEEHRRIKCRLCNSLLHPGSYYKCCSCPDLSLCLLCCSVCPSVKNHGSDHLPTHPFIIVSTSLPSLVSEDWSGEDELLLLAGIRCHGFCNWLPISKYVGRLAAECERHYITYYIQTENSPLPASEVRPALPPLQPPEYNTQPVHSKPTASSKSPSFASDSGYMACRHEFERTFIDEGEVRVSSLHLDPSDSEETFLRAVSKLLAYNKLVAVRAEMTAEIENWKLHESSENCDDIAVHCLHGETEKAYEINDQIISLGPFLGKEKIEKFAGRLHEKSELQRDAKRLQMNKKYGIQGVKEEDACATLLEVGRTKVWDESDIARWNDEIEKCGDLPVVEMARRAAGLSEIEVTFCGGNGIDHKEYMDLKRFLVREFEARGRVSEEAVGRIGKGKGKERLYRLVYEFLKEVGWIA
jgi:hypothetical protein